MLDKLCSHVTHNSIPFLRCRPRSWKLISFVLRNTSRRCFDPFSLSLSLEEEEEEEEEESCLEQLTQFDRFLLRFSPRIFLELIARKIPSNGRKRVERRFLNVESCLNEQGDRIGQLLDFQKRLPSEDFQRCCFHWGRIKIRFSSFEFIHWNLLEQDLKLVSIE